VAKKWKTRVHKIIGKKQADNYAWGLRGAKIKFKRRKVGPKSYEFTILG